MKLLIEKLYISLCKLITECAIISTHQPTIEMYSGKIKTEIKLVAYNYCSTNGT
jgi:hypothetical protein